MALDDGVLDRLAAVGARAELEHERYEFGELIGSGGMGSVYRARDRLLDRPVAVKVLRGLAADAGLAARLEQEARLLGGLDHPGLVPVHDVGRLEDGRPFYVMRLVRGDRLDRHFAQASAGLAERLRLFLRITEPVAFAHARGVVHRDLKPANVMVGPFGEVLVLDWGVAKVRGAAPTLPAAGSVVPGETGPGAVLGTEGYMAPEQAGAAEQADERSDVFALGAILRDLLAGPDPVPRPVRAIRDRAMAVSPDGRYPTVEDLAGDVARFLDGRAVTAYRERWYERAGRFLTRHQTAIGLILAYLVMRLLLLLFARR
ncbi:MAG: serine/threonine-protein kinase [Gemmatimonadales bacterium]